MKLPIYMDSHATTPVDPRVLEAMLPYFTVRFGNPSSRNHQFGKEAEEAVERARETVARLIHASHPGEIIFTSGATEADNIAVKGVARACRSRGNHIITAGTEHKAILDSCSELESEGFEITSLPVDEHGLVDPDDLRKAIRPRTVLISLMAANNEIGTIAPLCEVGKIARERGVLFHSDAVQAVGKVPVHVDEMNIDLMSITAHKFYGPKGTGALYIRRKSPEIGPMPLLVGGSQEGALRPGTLNVPGVIGLAKTCEISVAEMGAEAERMRVLRNRLYHRIIDNVDEVYLNGHPTRRLPQNLNLSFSRVTSDALMAVLPEIAFSAGSACFTGSREPSYVLRALGLAEDRALGAIRLGLHRFIGEDEIDYTAERFIEAVKRLRK